MVDLQMEYAILEAGERYPMLVDSDGMPDFYASLFISVEMRPKSQASTLEKVLSALRHLRRWEAFHKRNLVDEFYEGRLLEQQDLYSLRDHCKLDSQAFDNWVAQVQRVSAGDLLNVASFNRRQPPTILAVSSNHCGIRIAYIQKYLKFLAETVMRVRTDFVALKPQIDRMVENFGNLTPRGRNNKRNSGAYRTPPQSVLETYFSIAKPGSTDNPFKNPARQLRHYIMMKLQFEAGLRSGEVLGLWLEDIEYGGESNVHVVRRHHDPNDPRIRQAVAKTEPRILPIANELAKLIHQYVIDVRSQIPEAQHHPLIFVSHASNGRGKPISSKAIMQEMGLVIGTRPDTFAGLTRHQLRHGFTLGLKADLEADGISDEAQHPIVQYALGHANPHSQEAYTHIHNQKRARKMLREINRRRHINAQKDCSNKTDRSKDA
jgi:integrase